ncbi:hypothetical protein N7467_006753 [Penicillium canescens]|nr:hypothetical protein N7467_006753 [Penicillium canescens]
MSEKWADTALWLPVIRSLEPASLNGEFMIQYKETSQTKKPQTPNPHSMTGAHPDLNVGMNLFSDTLPNAIYTFID